MAEENPGDQKKDDFQEIATDLDSLLSDLGVSPGAPKPSKPKQAEPPKAAEPPKPS